MINDFAQNFQNIMSQERAQKQLFKLHMERGELDNYTSKYQQLCELARYHEQTGMICDHYFQGLPKGLWEAMISFEPTKHYQTLGDWIEGAIRQHSKYLTFQAHFCHDHDLKGVGLLLFSSISLFSVQLPRTFQNLPWWSTYFRYDSYSRPFQYDIEWRSTFRELPGLSIWPHTLWTIYYKLYGIKYKYRVVAILYLSLVFVYSLTIPSLLLISCPVWALRSLLKTLTIVSLNLCLHSTTVPLTLSCPEPSSSWHCQSSNKGDVFLRKGHVKTQISGLRWCLCRSLQCSNSGNISPIWILEGSAHWNPLGMHSGSIHEDGSSQIFPHRIFTFFLPDTCSIIHVLGICRDNQSSTYGYGPWHIPKA